MLTEDLKNKIRLLFNSQQQRAVDAAFMFLIGAGFSVGHAIEYYTKNCNIENTSPINSYDNFSLIVPLCNCIERRGYWAGTKLDSLSRVKFKNEFYYKHREAIAAKIKESEL